MDYNQTDILTHVNFFYEPRILIHYGEVSLRPMFLFHAAERVKLVVSFCRDGPDKASLWQDSAPGMPQIVAGPTVAILFSMAGML